MNRSHSRFTLIEVMALVAIMALIVVSVTPQFNARRLTASMCTNPDFRHHAECRGTGKVLQTAQNR